MKRRVRVSRPVLGPRRQPPQRLDSVGIADSPGTLLKASRARQYGSELAARNQQAAPIGKELTCELLVREMFEDMSREYLKPFLFLKRKRAEIRHEVDPFQLAHIDVEILV